jgi:hypothetical protein
MRVEPLVGLPDQLAVKPLFTAAGLVARDQQNCPPLDVECKSHPPLAISCGEPQLLHVRVARSLESVYARPPQSRSELLKQARQGQDLGLHVRPQCVEFRLKLAGYFYCPTHSSNMASATYDVNSILVVVVGRRLLPAHLIPVDMLAACRDQKDNVDISHSAG